MTTCHPIPLPAFRPPPSRSSNPFATCWTRPGALPFRFPEGQSAERLVARLPPSGWWGEIVGPHGSGKSTLLEALQPALHAAGCRVHAITLRDGQRRLPRGFPAELKNPVWHVPEPPAKGVDEATEHHAHRWRSGRATLIIVVDGYEQLGWLQKIWLKHLCRRAAAGLLVTAHWPTGLPTLIALDPDLQLVQQLVATLCARAATPVTRADVAASHACRGSNVRDVFFDLYDRHEQLRRSS